MLEYNLSAGILPLRKSFSKSNFIKTYTLTQLYESKRCNCM